MDATLRDKIEDVNTNGFVGIVELKSDYVLIQPKGVQLSKILVVRSNNQLTHGKRIVTTRNIKAHWKNTKNIESNFLKRVSETMKFPQSKRLYSRSDLLDYSNQSNLRVNSITNFKLLNENFDSKFYNPRRHKRIKIFSNNSGVITTDSDLIFKFDTFKSPSSDKEFSILFQPSKYLESEENIWMLISILGEKHFEKELKNNHSIINSHFILNTFRNSEQYFYISKENKKLFSSLNQRVRSKYHDISKIKLSSVLRHLDIPKIENLIEKGEIKY